VKQQQLLADLVITCCFKTHASVSARGNCSMRDPCKCMTAQQLCTWSACATAVAMGAHLSRLFCSASRYLPGPPS
jgi:hypothetical protein